MNQEFWNNRYAAEVYAYGKAPNSFINEQAAIFAPNSKLLCIAEGEGRNAVYLATLGHVVTAVDFSEEALKKTNALAKENQVQVNTVLADLTAYSFEKEAWDGIVAVFAHFPSNLRTIIHSQLRTALKPGGALLLTAYDKMQLSKNTGGPRDADMLYSAEEALSDFGRFSEFTISKKNCVLHEGEFHNGDSVVIEVRAKK